MSSYKIKSKKQLYRKESEIKGQFHKNLVDEILNKLNFNCSDDEKKWVKKDNRLLIIEPEHKGMPIDKSLLCRNNLWIVRE